MKSIADKIKDTIRPIVMQQAEAKTTWIAKIKDIKQTQEYQALQHDSVARYYYLTGMGYSKKHIIDLCLRPRDDIKACMIKEANQSLQKIDVAVAKKLVGLNVTGVELVYIDTGKDGFIEGEWLICVGGNKYHVFGFNTIYAGGYNVQCLHIRTKYKLSKEFVKCDVL